MNTSNSLSMLEKLWRVRRTINKLATEDAMFLAANISVPVPEKVYIDFLSRGSMLDAPAWPPTRTEIYAVQFHIVPDVSKPFFVDPGVA